ncbi:hypothetical protein NDU88_008437, partial [Pleurodeles waltl]
SSQASRPQKRTGERSRGSDEPPRKVPKKTKQVSTEAKKDVSHSETLKHLPKK